MSRNRVYSLLMDKAGTPAIYTNADVQLSLLEQFNRIAKRFDDLDEEARAEWAWIQTKMTIHAFSITRYPRGLTTYQSIAAGIL